MTGRDEVAAEKASDSRRGGPLQGLRIMEFVGVGPAPLAAMLLADLGADIVRVDRLHPSDVGIRKPQRFDFATRNRPSIAIDLKTPDGVACALDMVAAADGVIEGFRPGVMERLGLGPDVCLRRNPGLIFGRVTGWGQEGPLAPRAGHDLNYIALSGLLHVIGRAGQPPTPPLNLLGDYAGGALYLAFGMMCAFFERQRSGHGQIVDAAMIDGAAMLMTPLMGMIAAGMHSDRRGCNLLDSGAPHYEVYQCADGHYVAIAPLEERFRQILLARLDLEPELLSRLDDPSTWPKARRILADIFAQRSRAEWTELLQDCDACFAPVLAPTEAPHHPHHAERNTFVKVDGEWQPAPGPRFSRTPSPFPSTAQQCRTGVAEILAAWGIAQERIDILRNKEIVG